MKKWVCLMLIMVISLFPYTVLAEEMTVSVQANPYTATNGLFVDKEFSNAYQWVQEHSNDPVAEKIEQHIASVPTAGWFGDWNIDEVDDYVQAAAKENKLPMIVAYNIPNRDCGQHSAGGAKDADAYKQWIRQLATGIGQHPAIVILEPDALPQTDCLSDEGKQTRFDLLRDAIRVLKQQAPNTWVYLDGGHSRWKPADQMADLLQQAGVQEARGVSINVSNYQKTADEEAYAEQINQQLKEKYQTETHFVIDTSRNGNGSIEGEWCNPPGRKLGQKPQVKNRGSIDAYLWIKRPGESDGDCGIGKGTKAGDFSRDLALSLIDGK